MNVKTNNSKKFTVTIKKSFSYCQYELEKVIKTTGLYKKFMFAKYLNIAHLHKVYVHEIQTLLFQLNHEELQKFISLKYFQQNYHSNFGRILTYHHIACETSQKKKNLTQNGFANLAHTGTSWEVSKMSLLPSYNIWLCGRV